ncbi:RNA-directed DNA polymerase (Reverse transcriptase), partial [Trifolium medium]|nr:RNA-directed DNA polymerase (Reverse transcriptase) [Trifolium medium]
TARRCYQASLKTGPERLRRKESFESGAKQETVNFAEGFTDLDPREDFQEERANGKCRMCVDFTDLNKAYPKDPYPLPSIDRLIDGASGCRTLSFMDAYSGYNQIRMSPTEAPMT